MKTCFLFPGQGAQYPGMGKDLWDASTGVKELFRNASPIMKDRHRPGLEAFGQSEYLARRGRRRCEVYAEQLDRRLRESACIADANMPSAPAV